MLELKDEYNILYFSNILSFDFPLVDLKLIVDIVQCISLFLYQECSINKA